MRVTGVGGTGCAVPAAHCAPGAATGTAWGQWLPGTRSGGGTALGSTAQPPDPAPRFTPNLSYIIGTLGPKVSLFAPDSISWCKGCPGSLPLFLVVQGRLAQV